VKMFPAINCMYFAEKNWGVVKSKKTQNMHLEISCVIYHAYQYTFQGMGYIRVNNTLLHGGLIIGIISENETNRAKVSKQKL